jgi:hypothetical protein
VEWNLLAEEELAFHQEFMIERVCLHEIGEFLNEIVSEKVIGLTQPNRKDGI